MSESTERVVETMELGLKGKSAIVTGGSLGIGRAIALDLAREGVDVAVNYRRHDTEAKEVAAEIEKLGRRALAELGGGE